ncbi:hypothetical protein EL17_18255 [Anditalea andensis]|uniref:Uncharacterized protein n=1 Tax=Anditalea andensis TaxID=1048983 RepID=A0A074KWV4_9BACT|nr:hypothetical protein EL17_18255 [Anditalea andensis]
MVAHRNTDLGLTPLHAAAYAWRYLVNLKQFYYMIKNAPDKVDNIYGKVLCLPPDPNCDCRIMESPVCNNHRFEPYKMIIPETACAFKPVS